MKVILKVDDFWNLVGFQNLFDFIIEERIKISLGIIGKGLENGGTASVDRINQLMLLGLVEPFNHSYWHLLNQHVISEFFNTSADYQETSIRKTNEVIAQKLSCNVETIGFVANSFGIETIRVLNRFDDIRFIYALKGNDLLDELKKTASITGKQVLIVNEDCVIETSAGVDYDKFVANFSDRDAIFQMHPGIWKENDFEEFKKIILFLKGKGCEFIFPTQL